jgi:glutaredoxin
MSEPTIVIYTHPDCEYSTTLKNELDKSKANYKEIDISAVPGASEELLKITNGQRITPVIVEGKRVTIGYYGIG